MQIPPWPIIDAAAISWIDQAQMVEVDRIMIEDLHIELIQMMENAGRNLAAVVRHVAQPRTASVYVGSGGNGGGGLVAARHLANHGVDVTVVLSREPHELRAIPAHQYDIVERMGLAVATDFVAADVAVDALVGYSLGGAPRGRTATLIEALAATSLVVSLDVPSGVDSTSGIAPGVRVRADATLTLALPKVGLRSVDGLGRLFVGDISVPPAALHQVGATAVPPFADGPIVEISGLEEQRVANDLD